MLVHSVYFWLKPDLSEADRTTFKEGLESLAGIPVVNAIKVGTPAATPERPVIDASYDFGLMVLLDNMADHDVYQQHPLHQSFLEHCSGMWDRVVVYDFD